MIPINARHTLNEATAYGSAFSRGVIVSLSQETSLVVISGTASIDHTGQTVHVGDFRAQVRRTYANISALLKSADVQWTDVFKLSCYLRDIERDYAAFNEERNAFFESIGLPFPPASTGIQAILCRPELLIEMEAMAIKRNQ